MNVVRSSCPSIIVRVRPVHLGGSVCKMDLVKKMDLFELAPACSTAPPCLQFDFTPPGPDYVLQFSACIFSLFSFFCCRGDVCIFVLWVYAQSTIL